MGPRDLCGKLLLIRIIREVLKMTWNSFFSGTVNVTRITALVLLNVVVFTFNVAFAVIKFIFFILIFMLTLGKLGSSTMDFSTRGR